MAFCQMAEMHVCQSLSRNRPMMYIHLLLSIVFVPMLLDSSVFPLLFRTRWAISTRPFIMEHNKRGAARLGRWTTHGQETDRRARARDKSTRTSNAGQAARIRLLPATADSSRCNLIPIPCDLSIRSHVQRSTSTIAFRFYSPKCFDSYLYTSLHWTVLRNNAISVPFSVPSEQETTLNYHASSFSAGVDESSRRS